MLDKNIPYLKIRGEITSTIFIIVLLMYDNWDM